MLNAPKPRSRLYTSARAYRKGAAAVLSRRSDSTGVRNLEQALGELHEGRHAIAVPMARVGIYLVLRHLIAPSQKVILAPYTIADVVNMVLCAGGIPVFADVQPGGTCNIDPKCVEEQLAIHQDVGAVLVTHFYGLACDIDPILSMCNKRGIPVVEDAAQAFGARINGHPAGTLGHAGIFSFGLLKNVTSFVGGAVVTTDETLEANIRQELGGFAPSAPKLLANKIAKGAVFDLATNPLIFDSFVYWLFRFSYLRGMEFFKNQLDTDANPKAYSNFPQNYSHRMSDMQAEIVCGELPRREKETLARIENAKLYHEGLKDIPDLVLPPMRTDGSHIYLYYAIQCEQRDKLARFMTKNMRDVQISHHRNCASMPCFAAYAHDCPNAETAARNVIYLPTYPGYGQDQIAANVDVIRSFFRSSNSWT